MAIEENKYRFRRAGGPGSPGQEVVRETTEDEHEYSDPDNNSTEDLPVESPVEDIELPEFDSRQKNQADHAQAGSAQAGPGRDSGAESTEPAGRMKSENTKAIRVESLYNLELAIYTVSGHRYRAVLAFKDHVQSGRMDFETARTSLERVENEIRNRTFQRPITYTQNKDTGPVEYIFNPSNVECVSVSRQH